jgi:uncharacterized protein DUF4338
MTELTPYCLRGRTFTEGEIALIREVAATAASRRAASLEVCRRLHWVQPDGRLKDRACRDVLQRLEALGEIVVPPPSYDVGTRRKRTIVRTPYGEPESPIDAGAGAVGPLQLRVVSSTPHERLWDELVDRYHYLGYPTLVGPNLKIFVYGGERRLACLSWSTAAWKVAARDQCIGWTPEVRVNNLPWVMDNSRFLILPWVRSKNLASSILARMERHLPAWWEAVYHIRPLLMETFVDRNRFQGTCYQAANWTYVGETKGRAKWNGGPDGRYRSTIKKVYLRPLDRRALDRLRQPLTANPPAPRPSTETSLFPE